MQPVPTSLPPQYGKPISLDDAKRVMAAAEHEALANQWPMVIAIVDSGGNLVMLHTLDHAQHGSIAVARHKAETAANFKRPTKVFEDAVAGGGLGLRYLSISGICTLEGGLPLLMGGLVVGGIGVSGMSATQDGQIAAAGANVLQD